MTPVSPSPRPAALYGAFVGCTLIWGSTFLFIAIGNDTLPPVWGATLRVGLAAAVLLAVMALRRQPFPRGDALRTGALYGFFQFGLNLPLLYQGETEVPSGLSSVLFATIPLCTALMARAFGLEPLDRARIGGAVIALAGIGILFSDQLGADVRPLPLLSILAAVLTGTLGAVVLKRGPRQSPIAVNAVGNLVGGVVCLLWSAALREPWSLPSTWAAAFPVIYLALAGSVGAFVLWSWLVNYWDVTRTSYIAVVSPMVAVALGAWVRHERIGGASLLGAIVVLMGVAVGLRIFGGTRHR
jgi:drug/metabolite transporter (DMT)-like permease